MSIKQLTDRTAVLKAIHEYNQKGREAFLADHGFGYARNYYLKYLTRLYDAKAIVGVAYGYQYPERGPLRSSDFTVGEDSAARLLRSLGFMVINSGAPQSKNRNYWALCANPRIYRILDAIQHLQFDYWTTGQSDIQVGDRLLIWQTLDSHNQRGIVGLGEVVAGPEMRPDKDNPYWVRPDSGEEVKSRALVRYVKSPIFPIWLGKSSIDDFLISLSVARSRGGSVFKVSYEQWEYILDLAGGDKLFDIDEAANEQ